MASNIFIIGATGRLGGSLAKSLTGNGFSVTRCSRKNQLAAGEFSIQRADIIFVCVPDGCLESVTEGYAPFFTESQVVAHCSGAHDLSVLSAAARMGAHIGSLHPLRAVPSSCAELSGSFAAVDGDLVAVDKLMAVARKIKWNPFRISSHSRALYHCAASLAANGLVGLAKQSVDLLEKCGLPPEQALNALVPLMQSTLEGLQTHGLPAALTGPIARGDTCTISRHLEALSENASPGVVALYRNLATILFQLAAPQLSEDACESIRRLLEIQNQ